MIMLTEVNKLSASYKQAMEIGFYDLSDGSFKVVDLREDSFKVLKRHSFFNFQ